MLVHCDCGRRYMRIAEPRNKVESGFALCRCERMLGEWSGPMRYVFEPETEGSGPPSVLN